MLTPPFFNSDEYECENLHGPCQSPIAESVAGAHVEPEQTAAQKRAHLRKHTLNAKTDAPAVSSTGLFGVFVTAKLKGEIYPLQGWVISESPLRIKCSGGDEYECEGTPTAVINPPDRTPKSLKEALLIIVRTLKSANDILSND